MDKETLFLFLKRILETGSQEKSALSLSQLKKILETQGADPEIIELIKRISSTLPEARSASKAKGFSMESLEIAIRRGEERKRREREIAYRGRC